MNNTILKEDLQELLKQKKLVLNEECYNMYKTLLTHFNNDIDDIIEENYIDDDEIELTINTTDSNFKCIKAFTINNIIHYVSRQVVTY